MVKRPDIKTMKGYHRNVAVVVDYTGNGVLMYRLKVQDSIQQVDNSKKQEKSNYHG